ncbi:MAG: hypothetical protein JXR03_04530 [Cyclobacteriaceae bacterium]
MLIAGVDVAQLQKRVKRVIALYRKSSKYDKTDAFPYQISESCWNWSYTTSIGAIGYTPKYFMADFGANRSRICR